MTKQSVGFASYFEKTASHLRADQHWKDIASWEAKSRRATGEPGPKPAGAQGKRGVDMGWGAGSGAGTGRSGCVPGDTRQAGQPTALPGCTEGAAAVFRRSGCLWVQLGDPDGAESWYANFCRLSCPACAKLCAVHEQLRTDYIDTAKVPPVFFELPLSQHRNAHGQQPRPARCARVINGWLLGVCTMLCLPMQTTWKVRRMIHCRTLQVVTHRNWELNQGRCERCHES